MLTLQKSYHPVQFQMPTLPCEIIKGHTEIHFKMTYDCMIYHHTWKLGLRLDFFPYHCYFFEELPITQMFSQCINVFMKWWWFWPLSHRFREETNWIHFCNAHWEFQGFSFISGKIYAFKILITAKVRQLKLPSAL